MSISLEQIKGLAPDDKSVAAGRKLNAVRHWPTLGKNDQVLWGECKGSALYQVKIDLSNYGSACSCPSRKFPCKHALGLLMILASDPSSVQAAEPPEWVTTWLEKRQQRQEAKVQKAAEPAKKAADPKAQARRAAQRLKRVQAGLDQFELWLQDLVRSGLAQVDAQPPSFWNEQAKRLVDSQAPGLAARVESLAAIPHASSNWPQKLLHELGKLQLAVHAFRRVDSLSPESQADLRQLIGWTVTKEELQTEGIRIKDRWKVLGKRAEETERVRVERLWLMGCETGQVAVILTFAVGNRPFEAPPLLLGSAYETELLFYPSSFPQRAVLTEAEPSPLKQHQELPGYADVESFLDAVATGVSRQPWTLQYAGMLHEVTPAVEGEQWYLRDRQGHSLPLAGGMPWSWLAHSGGQPTSLSGEWDGEWFYPMGLFFNEKFRAL
ncbi:SWIM zinc finger protein [Planctomycetales bacterium 10988]|nr:SWIM zinc finger protein [Planctomycetales bacterium 10988]